MPEDLDPQRLREVTNKMVEAITSPAFVEAMRAVRSAPEDQRLAEASRRLAPEALKAQGVPLPADMRISSRYFEPGLEPLELGDLPDGRPNLINALNEVQPGLLDKLRRENPIIFEEIVVGGRRPAGPGRPGIGPRTGDVGVWGCACAGGGT